MSFPERRSVRPSFPRSVSYAGSCTDITPIYRHDIGVFWDLRRYHLSLEVVSVESVILALKFRVDQIKAFCSQWFGLEGLNVLVRFSVVCDLPNTATLEFQRQRIFQAFDDLEMQFCNVGGSTNVPGARREAIDRFVRQFLNDFPRPLIVVISDDIRLLQSVRSASETCEIVPVICRYKKGRSRVCDGACRQLFNRILAYNVVAHPWDVYFYETILDATRKSRKYPHNCLQILYSRKRDTVTHPAPLLAWIVSLCLQTAVVKLLHQFVFIV